MPKITTADCDRHDRTLKRSLGRMEARWERLHRELAELDAARRRARAALVRNRGRGGRLLSDRGRASLVARLEHAIMRSTIVIGETSRLHRDLGLTRDERRTNAGRRAEAAR